MTASTECKADGRKVRSACLCRFPHRFCIAEKLSPSRNTVRTAPAWLRCAPRSCLESRMKDRGWYFGRRGTDKILWMKEFKWESASWKDPTMRFHNTVRRTYLPCDRQWVLGIAICSVEWFEEFVHRRWRNLISCEAEGPSQFFNG